MAGTLPEDYLPGLRPLLDGAVRQSPEMIGEAIQIDVANAQKLFNGVAPMMPHMYSWVQYGQDKSAVASNTSASVTNKGYYYDLNFNQPVFKWGQLKYQLDIAKIGVELAQRSYADAYQRFVNALRGQYIDLIIAKLAARNSRFIHEIAVRQLELARSGMKAGTLTPGQVAGAEMSEGGSALEAERNDENYAFARRQFARHIGQSDFPDAEVPDTLPAPRYAPDLAKALLADLLSTGARYTSSVQTQLLNIRSSKLQYQILRVRQLMPMISIQADLNQQNQTNATPNSVQQTAITNESYYLRADIDVFDGLETRGRKQEALLNRRRAERSLKIAVDEIMDQAQNQERNLKFLWDALVIDSRRFELSNEGLRTAEDDFKRGVASTDQVAAAQVDNHNSEIALMQSRERFLTTWADFVAQVGYDPAMDKLPARYVRPVQ